MDLVFKRYQNPYLFMDGMIRVGRFEEFVKEVHKTAMQEIEEQVNWEYFLHKVFEGSFADFVDELETNKKNQNLSQRTIETTVQHTQNILNNFNPEKGGE